MTYAGFMDAQFTIPAGETISVTTNGGTTAVAITAGSYFTYAYAATLQALLTAQRPVTAGAWTVTLDATTGKYTIAVTAGTFSITWTSTAFRDLLGYTATITTQTSVTATKAARGIFVPDCPVWMDGDLDYPELLTDLRATEGPTGLSFGIVSNAKYRLRGLRYSMVAHANVFGFTTSGSSTPTWQQFLFDVHLKQGHSYFEPLSRVRINFGPSLTDDWVAYDYFGSSAVGWFMKGIASFSPRRADSKWKGFWVLEIPELVSEGI